MIFKQYQQVLDGMKIQTRRLMKDGDRLSTVGNYEDDELMKTDYYVTQADGRIRWKTWRTYAIQPRRGEKAVGRIRITKIRRERVQDISKEDVFAEGVGIVVDGKLYPITMPDVATEQFARLWNSIHKKPSTRWTDDPEVWALTFELEEMKG